MTLVRGLVLDRRSGGGEVVVLVDRDTESYPTGRIVLVPEEVPPAEPTARRGSRLAIAADALDAAAVELAAIPPTGQRLIGLGLLDMVSPSMLRAKATKLREVESLIREVVEG